MGFFGGNYDRPGPGIPKDQPAKKGLALFFDILMREGWSLLLLNLIYFLFCLPVVTIGPATAALSRVTVTMVRDKNVYAWRDFWEAFRKNWKQGLLFGILCTAVSALETASLLTALAAGAADASQSWMLFSAGAAGLVGLSIGIYIFPLIAYVELGSGDLLKNAVFLAFLGKGRTLAAVAVLTVLDLAAALLWPLSLPWLLAIHFSLCSLISSMWAWPVIQQYVVRPEDRDSAG